MIFVNFKTYPQGTGEKSLKLIKILDKVSAEKAIKIIPVVQAADVKEAASIANGEVWAQHVDPIEFGAHTGAILPEAVKEDGALGTFLNHSEKRFESFAYLTKARERARAVGLETLIFAGDLIQLQEVLSLKPDYVSYEPPELVGSTRATVATAHPDVIAKAAEIAQKDGIPLIVGAGVHSKGDVQTSVKLGAVGIAVATDIVKAEDPEKELKELVDGFMK